MNIYNLLKGEINQNELLNYYNATINYVKLPYGINGCVFGYKGFFIIFIDRFLSKQKKENTLLHELTHIELSQLEQYDKDLFETNRNKYEDEADKYLENILNMLESNI